VCHWQEDAVQSDDPDYEGGANDVSLNEARKNFKKYSVVDPEFKKYVREPREDEL
jgi:hypothetical protein